VVHICCEKPHKFNIPYVDLTKRKKTKPKTLHAIREIESELVGDSSGHPKSREGRAIMLHGL
jgi:hypothetical protein